MRQGGIAASMSGVFGGGMTVLQTHDYMN